MDKSIPKAKPLFKHYLKSSIPFSAPKKKDTFILQDFLQGSQNISDQNNEYTYITENNGPFPLDENYSHDENYYKEYGIFFFYYRREKLKITKRNSSGKPTSFKWGNKYEW